MKKHRFSVILMLAVITICMLLSAGCKTVDNNSEPSDGAVQAESKLEEIQERGVLKVGTTGDYQPVSYSGITITDARKEQALMSDGYLEKEEKSGRLDELADEYFLKYIDYDEELAPAA